MDSALRARLLAATRAAAAQSLDGAQWTRSLVDAIKQVGAEGEGSSKDGDVAGYSVSDMGRAVCDILFELLEDDGLSQEVIALLVAYVSTSLAKPTRKKCLPLASASEAVDVLLSRVRTCDSSAPGQRKYLLRAADRFWTGAFRSGCLLSAAFGTTAVALERVPPLLAFVHIVALEGVLDAVEPTVVTQLVFELLAQLSTKLYATPRQKLESTGRTESIELAIAALVELLDDTSATALHPQLDSLLRHIRPTAARARAAAGTEAVAQRSSIAASALASSFFLRPDGPAACPALDAKLLAFVKRHADGRPIGNLLQASAELGQRSSLTVNDEVDVAWAAFIAGGRLLELVRGVSARLDPAVERHLDDVQIQHLRATILALPSPPAHDAMDVEPSKTPADPVRRAIWSSLIGQLHSSDFLGPSAVSSELEVADVLPVELPYHHFLADLRSAMSIDEHAPVSELASATVKGLEAAEVSKDVATLCAIASAFSSLEAQRVLTLWQRPVAFLDPVRKTIDGWTRGFASESGAQQAFEQFGLLLGWISSFVYRLDLAPWQLAEHLGSREGFTASYVLASSASHPLAALDEDRQQTLASWIAALYGSEGIPDDLLSGTDPKILVALAPTLFRQSFAALKKGELDAEAVKEGLSYFEQALLGGCAGAVVGWMIEELERQGPVNSPYQGALLDIMQSMILAPSVNPLHLEPRAARALRLVRMLQVSPRPPLLPPSKKPLDVYAVTARLTSLGGTLDSPLAVCGNGDAAVASLGWEAGLRAAIEAEVSGRPQGPNLWRLLPYAPRALGSKRLKEIILDGTIRTGCGVGSAGVLKAWDAAAWRRLDRSIDIAATTLTWPWDDGSTVAEEFVVGCRCLASPAARGKESAIDVEVREAEREVLVRCIEDWEAQEVAEGGSKIEKDVGSGSDKAWRAGRALLAALEARESGATAS